MPKQITVHLDLDDPFARVRHVEVRRYGDGIEIALTLETDPIDLDLPRFTAREMMEIQRRLTPPPRSQGIGWSALLGAFLFGWWLGD